MQTPTFVLHPVRFQEKSILRNLMELYAYDFSEFEKDPIGPDGLYGYHYLDHYWTEENREAFLIKVDAEIAGFVLINQVMQKPEHAGGHSIAEFFIMRKFRRRGLGKAVAFAALDLYPGVWEVACYYSNRSALSFWGKILQEYSEGQLDQCEWIRDGWEGILMYFVRPASRA
ncbi:MAG: GNAT family N-acetyltransferase [Bacteroidota bacterium]